MFVCVFFLRPIAWHSKVNKKPNTDILITTLIVESVLKGVGQEKSSHRQALLALVTRSCVGASAWEDWRERSGHSFLLDDLLSEKPFV